jgi:exo-beta-1,3-glucanase (GH17 family)
MRILGTRTFWLTTSVILLLVGAVLVLPVSTKGGRLPMSYLASVQGTIHVPDYTIVPSQMSFDGDVVVCEGTVLDPIVASWCDGTPAGTIMLGVDPASPDPADWEGGSATAEIYVEAVVTPTVALLSVTWPDRDGKGIHSPQQDQLAAITWDGVPIWTRRTRDPGTTNDDYYAAEHYPILATGVLTQSITHTLALQVPASTSWDISSISIDLYPMWDKLRGIAYSPFRDCQNPHWGPFPTEAEVEEDIARLFHMTNGVRTYSALNITGEIPRIAHERGLPVCAGAWLGREKDAEGNPVENENREEIDTLIAIANSVPLDCVIVGNEVLLRQDLTEAELLAYINEVKGAVDVPVTTAETSERLLNHPDLVDALELLMIHIYPSWDGRSIDEAMDYVVQHYLYWRDNYPGKRIVIGETGWPSDGPTRGQAVPSLENQRRFFYSFLAVAELYDIEFYYFDAFDELWKREGGLGSHWGYAYSDRSGKHEVQSVLVSQQYLFPYSVYLPLALKDQQSAAVVQRLPVPQHALPDLLAPVRKASAEEFIVFDEYATEENHFAPSGWMGDMADLGFYECARSNPYTGEVSLQVTYNPQGPEGWAGIYWQEPLKTRAMT